MMCKYCDCQKDNGIANVGSLIIDSAYEDCWIAKDDKSNYKILMIGDNISYSEKIKFCPFCGRKLMEEQTNEV